VWVFGRECPDFDQHAAEVFLHQPFRPFRVAGGDRVGDAAVLLEDDHPVGIVRQPQSTEPVIMCVHLLQQPPCPLFAASVGNRAVELVVDVEEPRQVVLGRRKLLKRDQILQRKRQFAGRLPARFAYDRRFQGFSDEPRFLDVTPVDAGNERSFLRDRLDQLFLRQADERFPQRRPADAEHVGQFFFGQIAAGLQAEFENVRP